jgi:hypothetical protein
VERNTVQPFIHLARIANRLGGLGGSGRQVTVEGLVRFVVTQAKKLEECVSSQGGPKSLIHFIISGLVEGQPLGCGKCLRASVGGEGFNETTPEGFKGLNSTLDALRGHQVRYAPATRHGEKTEDPLRRSPVRKLGVSGEATEERL